MIRHLVKQGRIYRARVRLSRGDKLTDESLHTSDKQVAEKRLAALVQGMEQEREGIIAPKAIREGAVRPLDEHLEDFIRHLESRKRSAKYVANTEHQARAVIEECEWKYPKDATADAFQAWQTRQKKSTKTINDYLAAISGLFNWMQQYGRIPSNPLRAVGRVETQGKEVRHRRALNENEVRRLLAVAGENKAAYVTAVYTGLRRGELEALQWGDVKLDAVVPFLQVRASTTKNHKTAQVRLHSDVATVLRELRPSKPGEGDAVFKRVPRIYRFRSDLKRAGIPYKDGQGRVADFHSLRYTFATSLANVGAPGRIAMELMRHSDRRLTDKVYTDPHSLQTWSFVEALPSYTNPPSQLASQISVANGPSESAAVTSGVSVRSKESLVNIDQSHRLASSVTSGHKRQDGGPGRTRTYDQGIMSPLL